jgi:hypothetical protein
MDFSTMGVKIGEGRYETLGSYKSDFELMCQNCMTYNTPETVYHKAGQKLLKQGEKLFEREEKRLEKELRKRAGGGGAGVGGGSMMPATPGGGDAARKKARAPAGSSTARTGAHAPVQGAAHPGGSGVGGGSVGHSGGKAKEQAKRDDRSLEQVLKLLRPTCDRAHAHLLERR